jgi:two-component system, response regulator PdtaR
MTQGRVLIVEDHPDTQMFLAQVLKIKSYEPVLHSSALAALNDVQSNPELKAALIDLSLEMPVQDFIASLRTIEGLSQLPVIIVSGWDWTDEQARNAGAQAFLRKPCDLNALLNALKNVSQPPPNPRPDASL